MEDLLQNVLLKIIEAIIPIVLGLLGALFHHLIKSVKLGEEWDKTSKALMLLDETIDAKVKELNQTLVSNWKEVSKDGKLSEKEKVQLKEIAIKGVKKQLTPSIQQILSGIFGDLEEFISAKIEAKVNELASQGK